VARATRCTFLTLLTALLLPLAAMYAAEAAHRPNIIVFVTDDQVKEEFGCYGGRVLTPHIDRLAREGMRFENAHVPSTVCTPSRYTLLTGRYPGNSYFKPYLADHPRDRQGNPGFNVGLEDDNMNVGNLGKDGESELIQTTDFVPTFFDLAGVEPPADYRIDGTSLRPVFVASSHRPHEHLFFELGNARGVRTEDWEYIAIRYDTEHFRRIQSADLLRLPRALAYIGNDKTLSNNLGRRPHMLDSDQLYHLADDPLETTNLAGSQEHAKQLSKMKALLSSELKKQGRPLWRVRASC